MKISLTFVGLILILFASAQSGDDKISPLLKEKLQEHPDQVQPIIIVMDQQADLLALDQEFRRDLPSQKERISKLLPLLKNIARQSQQGLLDHLTQQRSFNENEIRRLWIANAIGLDANQNLIQEIAGRNDVAEIIWNSPVYVEEHECNEEMLAPPVTPNDVEQGLLRIKADKLWKMGYTGYGVTAFGADTGIEPFNPAYINRWAGLYQDPLSAWYEYDSSSRIPYWCTDHGTHTLGTILGLDRKQNDTIGVAFNANWIGGPILCTNFGTLDNIGAFEWALNPDDDINTIHDIPAVINNSWRDPSQEGVECSSVYVNALLVTEMAGIAVIFSAGNEGPDVSSITPPKNINLSEVNAFCVGNLNGNSNSLLISGSSSRGPSVCGGDSSLLIKPEVSAPGSNVRSCVPNRMYGDKSGTSMAAPHVAGAILLLKEAFPELMSEDFKLALYLSARDLGLQGEDNSYGRGIIDVEAAFNYLVDQGHTPSPPVSTNLDLIGSDTDAQIEYCGANPTFKFFVTNGGDDQITSFDYNILAEKYNGVLEWSQAGSWTGELNKNELANISISYDGLSSGDYLLKFYCFNPNGEEDPRPLNNGIGKLISIKSPGTIDFAINGEQDGTACEGSRVSITGNINTSSDFYFKWYSDFQNSDFLTEGKTYEFDLGVQPTELYAKPFLIDVGGEDIPFDGELTTGNFLEFLVIQPVTLSTIDVYAEEIGNRFLRIKDTAGQPIITQAIFVEEVGINTLDVDIELPVGSYIMDYFVNKPLIEKKGPANYPYTVGQEIRITGAGIEDTYPYFFNWTIEREYDCAAQAITVEPLGELGMELDFDLPAGDLFVNEPFQIVNNTTGASQFNWLVDGETVFENEESPEFVFDQTGLFELTQVALNADGCQSIFTQSVQIDVMSSIHFPEDLYQFNLFPNPAVDLVNVEFSAPSGQEAKFTLYDNLGMKRINFNGKNSNDFSFGTENLSPGLYFFEIQIVGKPSWIHKLVIQ